MARALVSFVSIGFIGAGCVAIYGISESLKTPKDVREKLSWEKAELLDYTLDPEESDKSYSNQDDNVWRRLAVSWSDDSDLRKFVESKDGETKETSLMNSIKTECQNALNVEYGNSNYWNSLKNARDYCIKDKN